MKAIVGVDRKGSYTSALSLLKRLDFNTSSLYMTHVAKPGSGLACAELSLEVLGQFTGVQELDGIPGLDAPSGSEQLLITRGAPAHKLLELADALSVDLICVAATHSGALSSAMLGSICRAFVIGARQSVLIAKGVPNPVGPVKAIFATDHSPYALRCATTLMGLMPCGLADVTVLSVIPPLPFEPLSSEVAEMMISKDKEEEEQITQKTRDLSQVFEMFGATSRPLVRKGDISEEIATAMRESDADLLILGAQGHGFIDRLLVGSVSLHQVVAAPFSVLVVRG